jgi:hypothetical protein
VTRWQNNAEGGTVGATVTGANSGGASGDAFTIVGSGGSITYDSVNAAHGTRTIRVVPVASSGSGVGWGTSGSPLGGTTFAARCSFRIDQLPPDSNPVIAITNNGSTRLASIGFEQTGRFQFRDTATVLYTSTSPALMPATTQVTLETWGTIASAAEFHCRAYTGDNPGNIIAQFDTSAANTGTLPNYSVVFGKFLASTGWATGYNIDDLVFDNALAGYIGPATSGATVTGGVTPQTATTGVARTATFNMVNSSGSAVTWGPFDWGDGTTSPAVTTAAGVTTVSFTRTPTSAGVGRGFSLPWSQA